MPASVHYHPWTHRTALLLTAATLLLIIVGGGVTTLRAGDTEPTWSLRFWEWFQPPSELLQKEGHIWEMSHRQLGTVVGFVAIAFIALLWRKEPRPWVRKLGYLAFAGVVAQGVLGGARVLVVSDEGDALRSAMEVETAAGAQSLRYLFALVHAGLAYLLFALMVCLVWLTSRHWREEATATDDARKIRRGCIAAAAIVFAQLLAGAYLRHALLWTTAKVVLHVTGALLVALAAAWLATSVFRARGRLEVLEPPALHFLFLAQLQIFLGILAFVAGTGSHARDFSYGWTAVLHTGHQVVGPLLFAGSALLVLRAFRSLDLAP
ncbi:MAG: hypothetical protein GY719_31290 [bacterium]|nr:hypothetical protein [bacterium]